MSRFLLYTNDHTYNLLTLLLGRHHLQRSNQVNKNFSKIITNGVLRSTYRKSAERRSSVQKKSKFDHNIIISG